MITSNVVTTAETRHRARRLRLFYTHTLPQYRNSWQSQSSSTPFVLTKPTPRLTKRTNFPGLLTGRGPTRTPGQEVFKFSRVESERFTRCLKYHGSGRPARIDTLTRPDPRQLIRSVKCPANFPHERVLNRCASWHRSNDQQENCEREVPHLRIQDPGNSPTDNINIFPQLSG